MSDTQNWVNELKHKRQAYGLSQNKLATASGITRPYLSDIENGKSVPTDQVKLALIDSLERFNPDNPLEMLFDYVRILATSPTRSITALAILWYWHPLTLPKVSCWN